MLLETLRCYKKNQIEKIDLLKLNRIFRNIIKINFILRNLNIKVVLKPHPFESKEIYRKAFPEVDVYEGEDVRDFLKKLM